MTTEHKESQEPINIKDVAYESQYRLRRRILSEAAKFGQVNLIMPHGEIRSFYPEIEGLPIIIYDSGKSFRAKKPLAVVKSSTISFPEVI